MDKIRRRSRTKFRGDFEMIWRYMIRYKKAGISWILAFGMELRNTYGWMDGTIPASSLEGNDFAIYDC